MKMSDMKTNAHSALSAAFRLSLPPLVLLLCRNGKLWEDSLPG